MTLLWGFSRLFLLLRLSFLVVVGGRNFGLFESLTDRAQALTSAHSTPLQLKDSPGLLLNNESNHRSSPACAIARITACRYRK